MRAPVAGCRTIGKGGSRMAGSSQKRREIARRAAEVYRARYASPGARGARRRPGPLRAGGLRDGEKLSEELSYPAEEIHPTSSPKIGQIHGTPHRGQDLKRHLGQLNIAMSGKRAAAIRAKLKEIVPEYTNGLDDLPEDAGILARPGADTSPHFSSAKWNSSDSTRHLTPRP